LFGHLAIFSATYGVVNVSFALESSEQDTKLQLPSIAQGF